MKNLSINTFPCWRKIKITIDVYLLFLFKLMLIPRQIFRSYDIRGLYPSEINEEFGTLLGLAFARSLAEKNQSATFIGRDCRHSSPALSQALMEALIRSGINVVDLGEISSPLGYFAVATSNEISSLMMVTASHNPSAYNGIKMLIDGVPLTPEEIQQLADKAESAQTRQASNKLKAHKLAGRRPPTSCKRTN